MMLIYDFDGTLTPYGCPRLPILDKCGSVEEFYGILSKKDLMMGFAPTLREYLETHGYQYNLNNICYNANTIELNPGVLEFLDFFHKNKCYQFVISASYQEYLKKTLVAPYVDKIFGTLTDGTYDWVLMPDEKIKIIKDLITIYKPNSQRVIYIGDGLTDRDAFRYMKEIGGTAILVYDETLEKDIRTYEELKNEGLIDASFVKDFSLDGSLFNYVRTRSLYR